jgi:hypothetical protein
MDVIQSWVVCSAFNVRTRGRLHNATVGQVGKPATYLWGAISEAQCSKANGAFHAPYKNSTGYKPAPLCRSGKMYRAGAGRMHPRATSVR